MEMVPPKINSLGFINPGLILMCLWNHVPSFRPWKLEAKIWLLILLRWCCKTSQCTLGVQRLENGISLLLDLLIDVDRFRFWRVACCSVLRLCWIIRNKLPCASIWAATSTCRTWTSCLSEFEEGLQPDQVCLKISLSPGCQGEDLHFSLRFFQWFYFFSGISRGDSELNSGNVLCNFPVRKQWVVMMEFYSGGSGTVFRLYCFINIQKATQG